MTKVLTKTSAHSELEQKLGYKFKSDESLTAAITHRSVIRSSKKKKSHYEIYEFLGDAVLDLAIAQLLIEIYPNADEGELTKKRAALVNAHSLADIAKDLNLAQIIITSSADRQASGQRRNSLMADVVESILGCIFIESGYRTTAKVVRNLFEDRLVNVEIKDYKTELQELLHALTLSTPKYHLEKVDGPDHAPRFTSHVLIKNEIVGTGEGATKKASEQEAAKKALLHFRSKAGVKNEH
jgi:ribonuclease III